MRCAVVLCVLWYASMCCGAECPAKPTSVLKFYVTSHRNQTGHWTAQVSLNHDGGEVGQDRPWNVDVEHSVTKCENTEIIDVVATATAPPLCLQKISHAGYSYVAGLGYYKFQEIPVTWPVARETCAKEGSHLLILNSEEEWASIKEMWSKYTNIATDWRNNFIHLGLTAHIEEGQFYTLFGEHINSTGYAKWAPNEPNSGPTASCLGVTREGLLMDSYCQNVLAYVCEQLSC